MDVEAWAEAGLEYRRDGAVAWLVLNRPERRNAITVALRHALIEAVAETRDDPEVRAVVLAGNGTAFCSGADLGEPDWTEIDPERRRGSPSNIAREDGRRHGWWRLVRDIMENEKPILAAVQGAAYGGGCNIALACDLVLAAESASFSEVFVKRGLPIEGVGAFLLSRSLSPARAKEMALFGDPISGARAEAWGLANRCVPDEELWDVASEWAQRLASLPTIGVGHVKGQITDAYESTFEQVWKHEVTLLGIGIGDDAAEAMAAFHERREPNFRGR